MYLLEKNLIEKPTIDRLINLGWQYLSADKLSRQGDEETIIIPILKEKLQKINNQIDLTEEDVNQVIRVLLNTTTDQNGHREMLYFLKYGVTIKTEKEKLTRTIKLFDYDNISKNNFLVTNQFIFYERDQIRLDLLLFVNGIPLVNIEFKNPYSSKSDYLSCFRQIKRYEESAPSLYKFVQIGIGWAEIIRYFPIVPWQDEVYQMEWKKENADQEEAIFEFLSPPVLLDLVRNFLFIKEIKGEKTKIIGRYMQYRAANKIYQRVIDNLEGKTKKNKGLIWHWQGSGKTLTMIFAAHKLFHHPILQKPTIFFIVDRQDLERQFEEELGKIDLNFVFEKIETIAKLEEILSYDQFAGKRGVFLTLIHKFNLEDSKLVEIISQKQNSISFRKNVICFIDEVHRSNYGLLSSKMKLALKNAFYFGFTGTPIAENERNTYLKFGYPLDEERYLDRYFIDEAEKDGFIVPIVYQQKKEKDVQLKREDLEWFLEKIDEDDLEEEVDKKRLNVSLRRKINEITVFLENPKRIEKIAQDVFDDFSNNYQGKFKGLIVTASRLACVRYKRILDQYFSSSYSEVVMTFSKNDHREIVSYQRELVERWKKRNIEEIIKEIVNKFKTENEPHLLIVTDMLITGFDEPKLGVIYLDKPLKKHRLLQTIARVNRPMSGKPIGIVVDYIGLFENLNKALKFYSSEEKQAIVRKGIVEKGQLVKKFNETKREFKMMFSSLIGRFDNESFSLALEIIRDEEKEKKFKELYRELRELYEYLDDQRRIEINQFYRWLTFLYERIKKVIILPDPNFELKIEKYFQKTLNLIRESIDIGNIKDFISPIKVDVNIFKKIEQLPLTKNEKIVAKMTGLYSLVVLLEDRNPIYRSIATKIRNLVRLWRERGIEYQQLFSEIEALEDYILTKTNEQKEISFNDLQYSIYINLENKINKDKKFEKERLIEITQEIYSQIKDHLFPNWQKNKALKNLVASKIRDYLAILKPEFNLSYQEFDELHREIFEFIVNYQKK